MRNEQKNLTKSETSGVKFDFDYTQEREMAAANYPELETTKSEIEKLESLVLALEESLLHKTLKINSKKIIQNKDDISKLKIKANEITNNVIQDVHRARDRKIDKYNLDVKVRHDDIEAQINEIVLQYNKIMARSELVENKGFRSQGIHSNNQDMLRSEITFLKSKGNE